MELPPYREYPHSHRATDIIAEKSRPDEETIIAVGDVLSPAAFDFPASPLALSPIAKTLPSPQTAYAAP